MIAWAPHLLSVELRRVFSYRVAFWVRYLAGTLTEITVAYFLWDAIFAATPEETLGGFRFHGILFYSIFAALGSKVVQGAEPGEISREIYEGGLSRYLLYPLAYLPYRYVSQLGRQLVATGQLLLGFGMACLIWTPPPELEISVASVALGIVTLFLSGVVLFLLNTCLELVAFWQDTVWNLLAMLRFVGNLLGGLIVPIALFPAWGREAVRFTPFPSLYSFPIRCFLGQVDASEWIRSALALGGWAIGLGVLAAWIWRRGTRVYSGVGI